MKKALNHYTLILWAGEKKAFNKHINLVLGWAILIYISIFCLCKSQ